MRWLSQSLIYVSRVPRWHRNVACSRANVVIALMAALVASVWRRSSHRRPDPLQAIGRRLAAADSSSILGSLSVKYACYLVTPQSCSDVRRWTIASLAAMRFPPSTATFGIAFALVNFGLLAYMGAPLPPQPWLSILIIFIINLLLAIYTPSIINLLKGPHARRSDAYRPAPEHHTTAAEERMINRTRVLIGVETYIAIFLRGSFKDGQYTEEYHNAPFMLLACFFGVWGGMAAIISEDSRSTDSVLLC